MTDLAVSRSNVAILPSVAALGADPNSDNTPCPWAAYYPPAGYGGLDDLYNGRPETAINQVLDKANKLGNITTSEKESILAIPDLELRRKACEGIAKRNDLSFGEDAILADAVRFRFLTRKDVERFKNPEVQAGPNARAGYLEYYEEMNKAEFSKGATLTLPPANINQAVQIPEGDIAVHKKIHTESGNITGEYKVIDTDPTLLGQTFKGYLDLTVRDPGEYLIIGSSSMNRNHNTHIDDPRSRITTTSKNEKVTIESPQGSKFFVVKQADLSTESL